MKELQLQKEWFHFAPEGPNILITCVTPLTHLALCSKGSESFDQYCNTGVRVYTGAEVLCWFMLRNRANLFSAERQQVIELGCGCALSGLIAAHFCERLVLSDMDEKALELAHKNLKAVRDVESHSPPNVHCRARIELKPLNWESEESMCAMGEEQFDIILASELVYYRIDLDSLFTAAKKLLRKENGMMLMCHHPRISNAEQIMLSCAEKLSLSIDFVKLESFLGPELIRQHNNWNTLQFAIVTHKNSRDRILSQFPNLIISEKAFNYCYEKEECEEDILAKFEDFELE